MMNLQKILDDHMKNLRAKEMEVSDQLTLGKIINLLENVKNKDLPIVFDNGEIPSCLGSWRGVYAELYIGYDGDRNCYSSDEVEKYYPEFNITLYKQIDSNLPDKPTVQDMLDLCKRSLGRSFTGYKGGDFTMDENTPLWVSQHGTSAGFDYGEESEVYNTKVVGVTELPEAVVIDTRGENY